jgi:hypothetical protein
MSQTSDKSRTFRVLNLTDEIKTQLSTLNTTVTQHENINYVEASSVDDVAGVKAMLDENEMKYKQCSYSTFVRFKDQLTVEQLNTATLELCEDANILYSRVNVDNHTGKLVVDRLEDYNKLKSNTGDISFYRFSPINVSTNQTHSHAPRNDNGGEWQTQQPRRQQVAGRYAQGGQSAPRTQGAPQRSQGAPVRGQGATRGRGGASRGRGGARSAGAPA